MTCPDRLYKYQSLSAYSLAALVMRTIWLAKPSTFNDPFDCGITLDRRKYKDSVLHAISAAIEGADSKGADHEKLGALWPGDKEAFELLRKNVLELVQNMGVCSFSAVGDHMLMWSHYAQHHRGFCVEYDSREGTTLRNLAHEVRYQDEAPSLGAADFAAEKRVEAFDNMWLTKATCWSYEQEWRVLMKEGNRSYAVPSDVLSIIFGARMPQSEREMVRNSLQSQPSIAFKEARLVEGQFRLQIVDV